MGEVRCQGWLCSHPWPNPGLVIGFEVPERAQAAGKGQNMAQE